MMISPLTKNAQPKASSPKDNKLTASGSLSSKKNIGSQKILKSVSNKQRVGNASPRQGGASPKGKTVNFVTPDEDSYDKEDDEDPFYRYSRGLQEEVLQTYELLEFSKKNKSFLRTCKLNNPRKNKKELLKEITEFIKDAMRMAMKKEGSLTSAQSNVVLCSCIMDTIQKVLFYNNQHRWTQTDINDDILEKIKFYLSDKFFQQSKVISLGNLVTKDDFKNIINKTSSISIYRMFDMIPLILNFQATILFEAGHINQSFNTIYQSILIKRLILHSHFDLFQLIHFALNFIELLFRSDDPDRAITSLRNVMLFTEYLIDNFTLNLMTTPDQIKFFMEAYRYIDSSWTDRETEGKLVDVKRLESASDEEREEMLKMLLRVRLLDMYKRLGEQLHSRGMYQEAYLAMNYHNNLYVDLVGDEPMEGYIKALDVLNKNKKKGPEEPLTGRQKMDENYFKRPWRVVKHNRTNEEGYPLNLYKKYLFLLNKVNTVGK